MQGAHRLFARFTGQMVASPPLPLPSLICRAVKIGHCTMRLGENRALHNAHPQYSTIRRIRPLPTFFATRPFLYKAFYNGVGGGGGAGGGRVLTVLAAMLQSSSSFFTIYHCSIYYVARIDVTLVLFMFAKLSEMRLPKVLSNPGLYAFL